MKVVQELVSYFERRGKLTSRQIRSLLDQGFLASDAPPNMLDLVDAPGTTYYFRVRAVNAGGDSPEPAGIAVTMPLTTPVRTTTIRAATAGASLFQTTNPIKDLLAA